MAGILLTDSAGDSGRIFLSKGCSRCTEANKIFYERVRASQAPDIFGMPHWITYCPLCIDREDDRQPYL